MDGADYLHRGLRAWKYKVLLTGHAWYQEAHCRLPLCMLFLELEDLNVRVGLTFLGVYRFVGVVSATDVPRNEAAER